MNICLAVIFGVIVGWISIVVFSYAICNKYEVESYDKKEIADMKRFSKKNGGIKAINSMYEYCYKEMTDRKIDPKAILIVQEGYNLALGDIEYKKDEA
ncbi:MAG: hypothetical protein J6U54_15955 [Clostridiales bacterium]|nr:hypothetical protein [Clostridiales bacterium]